MHINFAVFRHDAVDLFIWQGFQRTRAAFARTGAFELHRLRVVNGHFFFVVQTPQHVSRRQVKQLFGFDGFGQRRQVLEVIGLCVLGWQNLQQHTARSRLTIHFTGADEQTRRQLFRTHEVIFQAGCQGIPFEADHALIAFTFLRGDSDHQVAIPHQRFEVCIFRHIALNACDAAHLLLVIAVDHCQRHWAVTLQLHGNITGKFQRRGQQAGGNQQFAQQGLHRQRVIVIFQNLFPGFGYGDQFAAHGELFKQIAV